MYSIVWKYKIKPEFKEKFEFEYGNKGKWAKFFRASESYQGSTLHSSIDDPNTYLLIDQWSSREDYDSFLQVHEAKYQEMSLTMAHLYELEEKIGEFSD